MQIGELARRTGVSVRSLRYYEEQALLKPDRLANGYRRYAEGDVVAVQRIQTLLAAGLSSHKIERILPCLSQHDGGVALTCADLFGVLVAERDDMLGRIDALRASVAALDTVIAASPRS
ncbi:DNA-binding transcriptional MerR regulator [Leucobacter exalbidus]|uniref:DNA-binding transcriptional MerR regulator n=1 Tax=Leucobacter exalbidus TaxID=662960 RepID=A0A940T3I0_9MICO|nr:MerR family transcriptional regulator [Leucobacter exalbidus]MBP1326177.1 DNA-binding transcriptional MerR regulator [Leucobacter exalbidus]